MQLIHEDHKLAIKNWLHSQSQVTAFRINDEQLYAFPKGAVVIDEKKGVILFPGNNIKFKIWKRDEPRRQFLLY